MKQLDVNEYMALVGRQARIISRGMARAGIAQKNRALLHIAAAVRHDAAKLKEISTCDVERARADGHDAASIDRLTLTNRAIDTMATGLEQTVTLPDPIGEISNMKFRPTGIQVGQMRVPLGVIGIIHESRPNVTVNAAALCIKSGNVTVLHGGFEAIESNGALAALIEEGLAEAGLPANVVQVVAATDRAAVGKLITMTECVDVIVPCGGKSLIVRLIEEARVSMIKHLDGICHVCIDADADIEKAVHVYDNAETQRYASCNTMETLLVSRDVAAHALSPLAWICRDRDVELRVYPATRATLEAAGFGNLKGAVEVDWHTECLVPVLSIRTADSLDAAIEHTNTYGSTYTDLIITENYSADMRFLREVDSVSMTINASTWFADGFKYGLGAEIGISNDKLHTRGPVGLEGLTSLKYVVFGRGEIRT